MAVEALENEPLEINAGVRWWWKRSFPDFPASAGWVVTYYFVHPTNSKITITASADGDDHVVDEAAADTADHSVGTYHWQAFAELSGAKHKVDEGTLKVLPDYSAAATTTLDHRSHVVKTLAYIEACIEGNASKDIQSYTIEGRSLSRYSKEELLVMYDKYKWLVKQEEKAEKVKNGISTGNNVHVRFT